MATASAQAPAAELSGLGRYGALLRQPHVAAVLAWSIVARLPLGMAPLALILLVRAHGGSYAAAGAVAAAYSIALGVGAPVAGRQVDRRGRRSVLVPRALLYAGLLGLLVGLGVADAPALALAAVAAAAGLTLPPVGASVRTLLPGLVPGELRSTIFALEASLQELFFVGGPLLVALLSASSSVGPLVGAGVAAGLGTLALARIPPLRDAAPRDAHARTWLGPLAAPGTRTIVLLAVCMGLGFGALEVALPAFAEAHGSRGLAGVALASFSAGSLVGGLLIGLRRVAEPRRQLLAFALVLPAALALPLLAGSIPLVCVLLLGAGLPIAPLITAVYGLVEHVAPRGTHAEAFAWIGTAVTAGIASGTALGGWVVDAHGVRASMLCGVAGAALGALVAASRRRTLRPPEPATA